MRCRAPVLCFLALAAAAPAPEETQAELLRGVRAFRAARYDEALALFQQLRPQVPDIGFYLGTTLHKLGRHAEALGAFRAARRAGLREPVSGYYEALSCYQLGMLARARRGFQELADEGGGAGPRLRDGARRFLLRLATLEAAAPPAARYPAALERAAASDPEALEWLEEAALLLPALPDAPAQAARLRGLIDRWKSRPGRGAEAQQEAAALERLVGGGS